VKDLPKIELHLHIEGAAPPALIRAIAAEKRVDLAGLFDASGAYAFSGFADFLRVYEAATSVLTTPEDYARLTRTVCETLAEHGVIYAETFLSPDFCGGGDVVAWREYLGAIREAAEGVQGQGGPILKGIVTCIRHFGPERARAPAICAAETAGDFLTGFGMAGAETVLEPRDFRWAFDCAREAGLRLTAHAGEWRGPESVAATLDDLGVERIGHGVRAIEDPRLVERLAEKEITLEICPGSNLALGLYPDLRAHPIERLRAAGVPVTVSTDDPPFFHTTMTAEYAALHEAFGWEADDFRDLGRNAARAAFCDPATRDALLRRLDET
jgi:adenosine deaminase